MEIFSFPSLFLFHSTPISVSYLAVYLIGQDRNPSIILTFFLSPYIFNPTVTTMITDSISKADIKIHSLISMIVVTSII